MTNSENLDRDDSTLIEDLFRPVVQHRRIVGQATLAIVLLVAIVAGLYLVFQQTTSTLTMGFRPVFQGVQDDRYPNGLPFSSSDIVNSSIVDVVYEKNNLDELCSRDALRSALVVQETSPDLQFLSLEYQSRLSEPGLSALERQRLQEEFNSRRASLTSNYELRFFKPRECAQLSNALIAKVMSDVLETWATESEQKRGVLKLRVGILQPSVFDHRAADESLLVRADLVRSAMVRVIANITKVEQLPGAELIRVGEGLQSLSEVRSRVEDLMQARLDPLVALAGSGLGRQSVEWITQALNTATAQHQSAEKKAESYRQALREYSGMAATTGTPAPIGTSPSPTASSDVQTLTPQIDRTFIDRIVEMSENNTAFRQEITRSVIEASIEAVEKRATVEHYRSLLTSMQDRDASEMAAAEVERRLAAIVSEAKDATRVFGQIYDEFSRVALRAGPAMYQIERPVEEYSVKSFTTRRYATIVLASLLIIPFVLALGIVVHYHLRRFVGSVRQNAGDAR